MAAGNYYWVGLDRTKAASYYQRVLDTFPSGRNAFNAEWRVAWVAYLNRQPDAEEKTQKFSAEVSGIGEHARCGLLARPRCGAQREIRRGTQLTTRRM